MISSTKFIQKYHRIFEFIILISIILMFDILMMIRYQYQIHAPYYLLSLASASILPGLILFIPNRKVRLILYGVVFFFTFAIFVTDSCLYYYKGDIFCLEMVLDIGDGLKMGIKYKIFIAFAWWVWILILVLMSIAYIGIIRISRFNNVYKTKIPWTSFAILGFSLLILLTSPLIIKERDIKLYDSPQDKRAHFTTFGIATFNQRDFVKTITYYSTKRLQVAKAEALLETIDTQTLAPESDKFGSLQNQNVIMIMLETIEEYAVDPILTPTLYELLYGGYAFTNAYSVAKTNYTYDAEIKSLTSMMYYKSSNLMYVYAGNEFSNALPSILRNQGYTANSFHSYERHYFNRHNIHMALGFENFYAGDTMTFSPVDFWPLDSEMFTQIKDLVSPIQDDPFFSFIVTLSSHGSFVLPRTEFAPYYAIIEADGRYVDHEQEYINLLAAQMDLDKGLEVMVQDLKDKGLYDDTMIVLFSDHKNYSSPHITEKYSTNIETIYDYDRVPFSIFHSSFATRNISSICSQYDITPTILDLLGIPMISSHYYGQSVLLYDQNLYEPKPIIFGYNRWIDPNMIIYDKDILYVNEDAVEDVEAYLIAIQEDVFNTIEKFHAFFMTDYFRKTAIE